jgi:hypothetical protein
VSAVSAPVSRVLRAGAEKESRFTPIEAAAYWRTDKSRGAQVGGAPRVRVVDGREERGAPHAPESFLLLFIIKKSI